MRNHIYVRCYLSWCSLSKALVISFCVAAWKCCFQPTSHSRMWLWGLVVWCSGVWRTDHEPVSFSKKNALPFASALLTSWYHGSELPQPPVNLYSLPPWGLCMCCSFCLACLPSSFLHRWLLLLTSQPEFIAPQGCLSWLWQLISCQIGEAIIPETDVVRIILDVSVMVFLWVRVTCKWVNFE